MPEKQVDLSFRVRAPVEQPIARTAKFLKSLSREEERVQFALAIRAFWATHAYQAERADPEAITEIALQSILELSEQILQVALVAGLPIDQLNFKSEVLTLIQQTRQGATKERMNPSAKPSASLSGHPETQESDSEAHRNGAGTAAKREPPRPSTTKRRTLFED